MNLCEVFYDFHRASGEAEAMRAIDDLISLGSVVDSSLTPTVWQSARVLKSRLRRVSLADCFVLELAMRRNGIILTADHHEFDTVAIQAGHTVRFIR